MDRVPLLVGTKGPLSGKRYAVSEVGLMVGRDETCDVIIPDVGVSRQHARVLLHNAAVWVQDEGSRNGVFVDGKRVVRHRQLSPGVEMLIGEHAFTLELSSAPRALPSSEEKTLPLGFRPNAATVPGIDPNEEADRPLSPPSPSSPAPARPAGRSLLLPLVLLALVVVLVVLWLSGT